MPSLIRLHRLVLYGVVAALIYFIGLGRPALWEPDEGRYAEVAREMVASGDYLTPRNDWVRYLEKPPLVYWVTAASIKLLGRNELAVRAPAALASAGTVVLTAALGEVMFGVSSGLFAATAIALSPLFFVFARLATPDPLLTFFFSAGLAAFFAVARYRDFHHGTARILMVVAAAALALGTLVKGPVALVLGGAIGLIWILVERRANEIGRIRWLECVAIYLAIAAPWFILAAQRNPGFIRFFFMHEQIQRFVSSTEHGWGPWFFVPIVAAGTWPWLYFAGLGAAELRVTPETEAGAARSGAIRFLLIWFAVVLIFFSIPRSKLGEYILPALPPIAILAGAGLARLSKMEPGRARHLLGWFAAANLILMAGAAAMLLVSRSGLISPVQGFAVLLRDGAMLTAVWGSGAASFYLAARLLRSAQIVPWGMTVTALIGAAILAKARMDVTPLASYRELARTIDPYLRRGCTLASYHHFVQALPFYTETRERLVGYRGELAPFGDSPDAAQSFIATDGLLRELWSGPGCVILIANRRDLIALEALLQPSSLVIGSEGKKVALANQKVFVGYSPPRSQASPGQRPPT